MPRTGPLGFCNRVADRLDSLVGHWLLALAARISVSAIFFFSGRTKVDGLLAVNDTAYALFREEYKVPMLAPELAAQIVTYAEHLFPIFLVLGFLARLSALVLLGITVVIQIFVYPDAWPTHLAWAVLLLYVAGRGAGPVSLDRVLGLK